MVRIAKFFNDRQKKEQALTVLKKAIEYFPESAFLNNRLGIQYEKMEMPYKAAEAFNRALSIEPHNRVAEVHLMRLAR